MLLRQIGFHKKRRTDFSLLKNYMENVPKSLLLNWNVHNSEIARSEAEVKENEMTTNKTKQKVF